MLQDGTPVVPVTVEHELIAPDGRAAVTGMCLVRVDGREGYVCLAGQQPIILDSTLCAAFPCTDLATLWREVQREVQPLSTPRQVMAYAHGSRAVKLQVYRTSDRAVHAG